MTTRTQSDRELDWATGRDLERKDAEIDRLKKGLRKLAEQDYDAGYTPEEFAEAILSNWPGLLDDGECAPGKELP